MSTDEDVSTSSPSTPPPPVLDYLRAPARQRWLLPFVFGTLTLGGIFWRRSDWNAYVMDPVRGPWPKFELPLPVQMAVSVIVGALITGGVLVGFACLRRLVARRQRR